MSTYLDQGAYLSACGTYRYGLWRRWAPLDLSPLNWAMFIGLNPSTADGSEDDPTIRRCVAYAKMWGYRGLLMANLFAFRATEPADMLRAADPVGPSNDSALMGYARMARIAVAAWGQRWRPLWPSSPGASAAARPAVPAAEQERLAGTSALPARKAHPAGMVAPMNKHQHPSNNDVLRPPVGVSHDDCGALPITRIRFAGGEHAVVSYWTPDTAELARLNAGKPILLIVTGNTHPPISMHVDGEAWMP